MELKAKLLSSCRFLNPSWQDYLDFFNFNFNFLKDISINMKNSIKNIKKTPRALLISSIFSLLSLPAVLLSTQSAFADSTQNITTASPITSNAPSANTTNTTKNTLNTGAQTGNLSATTATSSQKSEKSEKSKSHHQYKRKHHESKTCSAAEKKEHNGECDTKKTEHHSRRHHTHHANHIKNTATPAENTHTQQA